MKLNLEEQRSKTRIREAEKRASFVAEMNAFKQEKIEMKKQREQYMKTYRDEARDKYLKNRRNSEQKKFEKINQIQVANKLDRINCKEKSNAQRIFMETMRN